MVIGGQDLGLIYEGDKLFRLVMRLDKQLRRDVDSHSSNFAAKVEVQIHHPVYVSW
jgi:Cu/Ag efflux pump CusA